MVFKKIKKEAHIRDLDHMSWTTTWSQSNALHAHHVTNTSLQARNLFWLHFTQPAFVFHSSS